jgi:hypothetical protein
MGQYWDAASTNSQSSSSVFVTNGTLVATRVDPTVDYVWGSTNLPPGISNPVTFQVRWTGQVQPQYSESYYFEAKTDNGVRLYLNGQPIIDQWPSAGDYVSAPVDLVAGIRYDIRMEYWQNTSTTEAHLYWYSVSQPKQIIPQARLYPTNAVPAAPPAVVSVTSVTTPLGAPFTNAISANNGAGLASVAPVPPGLDFDPTNKVIKGIPTQAGRFQININATNSVGSCLSVLDLTVVDTGYVISREIWTNVPGIAVTNIPTNSANIAGQLATLESPTDYGDNFAERLRGYLTAPVSGNYYFWIAASDAAELWISNDGEPVNKVKRSWVAPSNNPVPPFNGTASRSWTNQLSQKSPWLALSQGQRYYIEVLHKAGTNTGDNLAVGWVRPDQTNSLPAEIVPGYVLSPYIDAVINNTSGTLYTATMLAQGAVNSAGFGTATLRLSADETQANLKMTYTNLSSAPVAILINSETFQTNLGQTVFNVGTASPLADGSYNWPVQGAGTLTSADVLEIIKEGKSYVVLNTTNYPNGELRGNFTFAVGSSKFSPPPPPPVWADDHASSNAAVRFLTQATFGPGPADIDAVRMMGYDAWITNEFAKTATHLLPYVLANKNYDPTFSYPGTLTFNSWWEKAITADDQLRQRVAFALSEILVISDVGTLNANARVEASYYDVLLDDAFGNFRQLLEDVTLSPGMGLYLDMRGNDKGSITAGTHPNENYAREIMQLFSVGLYKLWPDGTLVMNSLGNLVPTYDQKEITGNAAVFTGWNYYQASQTNGRLPTSFSPSSNYTNFMTLVPSHHDQGPKRVLNNVILPPATGLQTNSANVDYDTYAQNDLEQTLDAIFYHDNLGPYICRQLIQRLVTSAPGRDYVYRVVQKFNDNGNGVRGDMQAVIRAILMDREARDPAMLGEASFGKQREPLLRITALARAFPVPPSVSGTYSQTGTQTIAIALTNAHRMSSGDSAKVAFTSGSPLPTTGIYTVTPTGTNTLAVTEKNDFVNSYIQSNGVIDIQFNNHFLNPTNLVYLKFLSGGVSNGVYQVATGPNTHFTVFTGDTTTTNGNCLVPRITGGYVVNYQGTPTNAIKITTASNHGLNVNDPVFLNFTTGTATDGVYVVSSTTDDLTFWVATGGQTNQTQNTVYVYPLVSPQFNRSGTVTLQYSTYNMGSTDTTLTQTPLNSPTVFNYFFPGYTYPGALASAGLTTPEFQITSDSGVANINNFLANGIINSQGTNATMSSFSSGGEAVTIDLTPWCSSNNASSNGIPGLVNSLSTLLTADRLSPSAKTNIIAYVAPTNNLPFTVSNPTAAQIRDRVRAVVHLIVTSPTFTIQK